jgi:hypothetical protein
MASPTIDKRGDYFHFMLLDGPDDNVKILIDDEFGYPTAENCREVWARYFMADTLGNDAIAKALVKTPEIVELWEPPFSF